MTQANQNSLSTSNVILSLVAIITSIASVYIAREQYNLSIKQDIEDRKNKEIEAEKEKKDKIFQLNLTNYNNKLESYNEISQVFDKIIQVSEDEKNGHCCNSLGTMQRYTAIEKKHMINGSDFISQYFYNACKSNPKSLDFSADCSYYSTKENVRYVNIAIFDNGQYLREKYNKINEIFAQSYNLISSKSASWSQINSENLLKISNIIKKTCPNYYKKKYDAISGVEYYEVLIDIPCGAIQYDARNNDYKYIANDKLIFMPKLKMAPIVLSNKPDEFEFSPVCETDADLHRLESKQGDIQTLVNILECSKRNMQAEIKKYRDTIIAIN